MTYFPRHFVTNWYVNEEDRPSLLKIRSDTCYFKSISMNYINAEVLTHIFDGCVKKMFTCISKLTRESFWNALKVLRLSAKTSKVRRIVVRETGVSQHHGGPNWEPPRNRSDDHSTLWYWGVSWLGPHYTERSQCRFFHLDFQSAPPWVWAECGSGDNSVSKGPWTCIL